MEVTGQLHARDVFTPGQRTVGIHLAAGWAGNRDSLKVSEKSDISCTAGSRIPQSLYRLQQLCSYDDDYDDDHHHHSPTHQLNILIESHTRIIGYSNGHS